MSEPQSLLVDRKTAARMLSISTRALDYLIAGRKLTKRRIGSRVLVPMSELNRFVRRCHPEPVERSALAEQSPLGGLLK